MANHWSLPEGLSAQTPRATKMRRQTSLVILFLVVSFALPLALTILQTRDTILLLRRGVDADSIVTGTQTRAGRSKIYYYATYDYAVVDATHSTFHRQGIVPADQWSGLAIGQHIATLYDPLDPTLSAINIDNRFRTGALKERLFDVIITGALYVFVLLIVAIVILPTYLKERWLLRWGIPAPARILSEKEYKTRTRMISTITYSFTDASGNAIQGMRKGIPAQSDTRERFARYRATVVDNPIVLFDPNNSARNMLGPPAMVSLS